ncbi:hypothetical protein [Photobacterium sp. OFAV2-7]|uniref:hypothetical protein n=1 Tax=Photobacterium sp. OFAV2-7 TaxID=2917748 RepID=UPI001EF56A97|nr:hypothetical protein [Photobacterium sp. OFAV2-7]MCG7584963.1 hypothetical protein [Photobacterium sp. OFAV2-7]
MSRGSTAKLCVLSFIILVAGCRESSNNSTISSTQTASTCQNRIEELRASQIAQQCNVAIIKSIPAGSGEVFLLLETLSDLKRFPGRRHLHRLDNNWNTVMEYKVSDDESLLDFELHPSGEISLMIVSTTGYTLRRINAEGNLLTEAVIPDTSPPSFSLNVVDIEVSGETILAAARNTDFSVHLHKFSYTASTGYLQNWTVLIEPAIPFLPWLMTGGSYDTFEQLVQPYQVFLALDQQNNAYVVVPGLSQLFYHHNQHFNENIEYIGQGDELAAPWPQMDPIITKVTTSGERTYTSVVGTDLPDEVYGAKVINDFLYIFGRTTRELGTHWDAFIATMKIDSGASNYTHNIDIDDGDIIYDVALLPNGNIFAVGATAWAQNPYGFSVSENSTKLAALIDSYGKLIHTVTLSDGDRHNQLRSVSLVTENRLLLGGFENGPGTHSGDADHSLVKADSYLQAYAVP